MKDKIFKLGTRGSPLAIWQADRVKALLQQHQPKTKVEIIKITTSGDKILDKPLVQIGGKGIFTKEIEEALLREEIDFAVHSFKDLPTVLPAGLEIVCIPERDLPFDALFAEQAKTLADLPKKPVIATGSLRRRAQVLIARPDAIVQDLRGNVNTRLRKYHESNWDGMIMALAAIRRMEWEDKIAGYLQPDEMLPAPAQGALAIEARTHDEATRELLQIIHNENTAAGVLAERSFLATLEGGCQVPMAAYAELEGNTLTLHGLVSSLEGERYVRDSLVGSKNQAEQLGIDLANHLKQAGAQEIIDELIAQNRLPGKT